MKLPTSDTDGAVRLERVKRSLREQEVSITESGETIRLEKDGIVEHHDLPGMVNRFVLQQLARSFGLDYMLFYHDQSVIDRDRQNASAL